LDLIDRLRNPRWLVAKMADGEDRRLDQAETIAAMREAADEIEHLRAVAGSVSCGESFEEMKKRSKQA
jgi:hypothetical protein